MDVISGRAFVKGELTNVSIGFEDGVIKTVGKVVRGGDRTIDLGDRIILPGFVDPHVHFRDPGMTQKEDFGTGTASAVCGGVTCILDMPNTKPPATDLRSMMEKKAYCDYGLFAAVTPGCNAGLLAPVVAGFKIFMGSTTGNILMNDDTEIAAAMADIALTGRRVSVHAEDDSMIGRVPEHSNQDHLRNRPVEAEFNALRRLSRYKGMKVNICHVTDPRTLRSARDLGFTTEVTLHHMLFDSSAEGAEYKVNPPLRDAATREALFSAFRAGEALMIGTDHAPHTQSEKSQEYDAAPGGIPGVETTVPILMNMVRKGQIPLSMLVSMGSSEPSKAFGINKGEIAVGRDADFAVFDTRSTSSIDVERLHSRAGHSPYAGMEAVFPDTVMVRGEVQVEDGEFVGERIGADIRGKL
jgi:dihydroorotase